MNVNETSEQRRRSWWAHPKRVLALVVAVVANEVMNFHKHHIGTENERQFWATNFFSCLAMLVAANGIRADSPDSNE